MNEAQFKAATMGEVRNERCTYVDCVEIGIHAQIARDGSQWASLCGPHDAELNKLADAWLVDNGGIEAMKRYLSSYVKAQGGAKAAARRVMGRP